MVLVIVWVELVVVTTLALPVVLVVLVVPGVPVLVGVELEVVTTLAILVHVVLAVPVLVVFVHTLLLVAPL